ncbi:unnamed protein product, partial [Ectocarpus fasciculatus]
DDERPSAQAENAQEGQRHTRGGTQKSCATRATPGSRWLPPSTAVQVYRLGWGKETCDLRKRRCSNNKLTVSRPSDRFFCVCFPWKRTVRQRYWLDTSKGTAYRSHDGNVMAPPVRPTKEAFTK